MTDYQAALQQLHWILQKGKDQRNYHFHIPPKMLLAALDMLMYGEIHDRWIALSVAAHEIAENKQCDYEKVRGKMYYHALKTGEYARRNGRLFVEKKNVERLCGKLSLMGD